VQLIAAPLSRRLGVPEVEVCREGSCDGNILATSERERPIYQIGISLNTLHK
jgi:hypothetical protein